MTELSGQVHSMGGLMVKPVSRDGLAEVVPARPGPKAGHKLTEPVVDHLEALVTADPSTRPVDMVVVVAEQFGVVVHPRSIGRALARRAEARARQGAPKTG